MNRRSFFLSGTGVLAAAAPTATLRLRLRSYGTEMIQVEVSVAIKRPPEEVFLFLANTENETKWQPGLIESKFTSAEPMGLGTTGRDVRQFMGMRT